VGSFDGRYNELVEEDEAKAWPAVAADASETRLEPRNDR